MILRKIRLVFALFRFAPVLLFVVLLSPLQYAALRGDWPLAGRLPVWVHRLFLALFQIRVTSEGVPPREGEAVLVVSNHVSWLDVPTLGSLMPLSFVAKAEIDDWPIVNWFARLQRTIFIDRTRRQATATANDAIARRLERGEAVLLFPEGTTGDGNRLLPFRSSLIGAVGSAHRGIRLQPLSLVYAKSGGLPVTRREKPDIAWYGDMEMASHFAAFAEGGALDVHVVWGDPIVFEGPWDRKQAAALCEKAVRNGIYASRRNGA